MDAQHTLCPTQGLVVMEEAWCSGCGARMEESFPWRTVRGQRLWTRKSKAGYCLEAMSLKPFTYPFPETRFLHSGTSVYKFKIRYGDSIRGEDIENKEVIIQELEDSIRVVLGNLDTLQPFATEHFVVFPYKSKWERVSHLKFKNGELLLVPYPFVLTLYVELKWFHENVSSGRPMDDRSLGLVSAERKAARPMKKKRKRIEMSIAPSRPGLDRATVRTASRGPSKKKLLLETSRREKNSKSTIGVHETLGNKDALYSQDNDCNRDRNAPQEGQGTPAFGGTDLPAQGSRRENSLAGELTPPLQQSNAPPPAGPTDLGTSGFFGFLSSLFPFRYFFGKSGQ